MKYKDFKGKKISKLGFGAMRLPMNEDGLIDYEAGQAMIDYALANGINYFDTAYLYHAGKAEIFLGEALSKHPRDSFYLANKLPLWPCKAESDVVRLFEKQLGKCKVDFYDFYLLHNLSDETWEIAQKVNAFERLKQYRDEGKITHLGASFHCSPELFEEILTKHGDVLEFVQLQLNYFDWDYIDAKALYNLARKYNKPIMVMEPLRGGMLAKPLSPEARTYLDAAGASYPSYGLRFADELEGVVCTLSGMSTYEQLAENIEILSGPEMNEAEKEAVQKAAATLQNDILIPCTGCNYCYNCPSKIKISEIFSVYNDAAVRGFHYIWGSLSGKYNEITPNASACIGCGVCEFHCPQQIKIIEKLKEVHAKYQELAAIGE